MEDFLLKEKLKKVILTSKTFILLKVIILLYKVVRFYLSEAKDLENCWSALIFLFSEAL